MPLRGNASVRVAFTQATLKTCHVASGTNGPSDDALPPRSGQASDAGAVVHSPDVTTPNPHDIDWAEVAARARADLGDEQIARFSDRLRKAMNVTADTFRVAPSNPATPRALDSGNRCRACDSVPFWGLLARPRSLAVSSLSSAQGTLRATTTHGGCAHRSSVKFANHAEETRWDLRVTELFRRTGGGWERFHRHADPFIDRHDLDQVLTILG